MAKQKMASLKLDQRLAVCDALVDGADHQAICQLLSESGLSDADMPSPHSLKTYQEGEEYREHYAARVRAYRLAHWEQPEPVDSAHWSRRLEGDMLKALDWRLNIEDLSLADIMKLYDAMNRQRALDLRERQLELKTWEAAQTARQRGLEPPPSHPARREEIPGKPRKSQDIADTAPEAPEAAAETETPGEENRGKSRISQDNGEKPSLSQDEACLLAALIARPDDPELQTMDIPPKLLAIASRHPKFANSPSPATRSAARRKRKKSKR